ncbi:hypothetical protein G6O69_26870 [Pseudenhygromyxa sp. WMMC2535]|uniref:hypothetical protein n=1 Tax=Pseudenhygromyxa sp. WMMC2535 TaxID=2712867 RepID=UPI001595157E|nr:hypothetical protein [Pseudenhygromyxa sp. WMMC2535]NVB41490.1 hypothetical protein [Pseudenhygromyxa sp. WMMC2535]
MSPKVVATLLAASWLVSGCGGQARALVRSCDDLGKAVRRQEHEDIEAKVLPASRSRLDYETLLADEAEWGERLSSPTGARPEALLYLGNDEVLEVIWTDKGWRFASDPTVYFGQSTPREALRSLVRASREGRWDVMLDLAPRRYRMGLSTEDLEKAWTDGEQAKVLQEARDRLAAHLSGTIRQDAHQAILDLGDGEFARLEREKDRWVVVDF